MPELNYHFIKDFHKSRKNRIGASDVPHLVPHPIKQIESLAAWTEKGGKRNACTALDLYDEKINGSKRESSFPGDMGHNLEPYALFEFIKDNIDMKVAQEFFRGYMMHKLEQDMLSQKAGKKVYVNPKPFNTTPFLHNTEALNDFGVAHIDCLFDPSMIKGKWKNLTANNKKIKLDKPFNIQAKSANYFSVSARKKDEFKGYDLDLHEWQGVPLSVFFQTQYEKMMYGVNKTHVALIYNTNSKHYWEIKRNAKYQRELIQIAQYMKQCIDSKTPPKNLVMNSKDIQALYPEIKDDFREIKDEELAEVLEIIKLKHEADEQVTIWEQRKKDRSQRMSAHLQDTKTIKGMVNGSLLTLAKWKKTGGGVYIQGLKDIKKREDSKKLLRYFEKNDLIKEKNSGLSPTVMIKSEELE